MAAPGNTGCALLGLLNTYRILKIDLIVDGIDEVWNFKAKWDIETSKDDIDAPRTGLEWTFSLLQRKCLHSATLIVSSRFEVSF